MKRSHSLPFSSRQEAVPLAPEVSRAPGDIENATEAPSRAKTGVLENGTSENGALENGTSEEPVGQIPPAGGTLRLVRTYAPDERNQLNALRLLAIDPSFIDPPSTNDSL